MSLWAVVIGLAICQAQEIQPGAGRIETALTRLQATLSGKNLVALARQKLPGRLEKNLVLDRVSRTDAVLTRTFDPGTGREQRVRETTIYLRSDLSDDDIVLDLAHELTHAVKGPAWDPYDVALTRESFVKASIQGSGGELDALETECQVAIELADRDPAFSARVLKTRCGRYLSGKKVLRRAMLVDFYKVGSAFHEIQSTLPTETLLSADEPELFSSTGRAPYPVALLREYQAITQAACSNTERRLASASSSGSGGRMVAQTFLEKRCQADTLKANPGP